MFDKYFKEFCENKDIYENMVRPFQVYVNLKTDIRFVNSCKLYFVFFIFLLSGFIISLRIYKTRETLGESLFAINLVFSTVRGNFNNRI